jgi:hypothetical protein
VLLAVQAYALLAVLAHAVYQQPEVRSALGRLDALGLFDLRALPAVAAADGAAHWEICASAVALVLTAVAAGVAASGGYALDVAVIAPESPVRRARAVSGLQTPLLEADALADRATYLERPRTASRYAAMIVILLLLFFFFFFCC